jgi:hypothetical protein
MESQKKIIKHRIGMAKADYLYEDEHEPGIQATYT